LPLPEGGFQSQERLATNFSFEDDRYLVYLHRNEIHLPESVTSSEEREDHFHPFGEIAVAVQGGAYFMDETLSHGLIGINGPGCSIVCHRKMRRDMYEKAAFDGIAPLSADRKSELLQYFRTVLLG